MNNNNFLKFFSIIAFIAFMMVSCWATVESLHMSLPWPKPLFWIATIGIFVLSSLGSKLVVDSFNQRIRVDNRGWRLIGGVLILLVFWVLFSLTTNTHTFFYNARSKDVVMQDLGTTKNYLQQLSNNTKIEDAIKKSQNSYEEKVWNAFKNLKAEIENPNNTGWGPVAKDRLNDLNAVLGGQPLAILSGSFSSAIQRQKLIMAYQQMVAERIAEKKQEIAKSMTPQEVETFKKEALADLKDFGKAEAIIKEKNRKGTKLSYEDVQRTNDILVKGYTTIMNHSEYVEFSKDDNGKYIDKQLYVPEKGNIVTKTSRLLSVVEVWQDYFKGKYKGMGFIYWILIAALVDIAGFIFFDLAFRRTE